MSVFSASHIKCVACDSQASLHEARNDWWICTTCGSYICPNCRALFFEPDQGTCPGTIVRAVEPHSPHFARFLAPRQESEVPEAEPSSTLVILDDVTRSQPRRTGGKVVILPDEERDSANSDESDTREANDD